MLEKQYIRNNYKDGSSILNAIAKFSFLYTLANKRSLCLLKNLKIFKNSNNLKILNYNFLKITNFSKILKITNFLKILKITNFLKIITNFLKILKITNFLKILKITNFLKILKILKIKF